MSTNLVGKESIFREVIRLAEDWKQAMDSSGFEGGSLAEIRAHEKTPAGQKIQEARDALRNYMRTLSFDDIKMLQVVMYLGRDKEHDKSLPQDEIYDSEFEYRSKQGWKTKDIEIIQMVEKAPLASYLKSGLNILGITV